MLVCQRGNRALRRLPWLYWCFLACGFAPIATLAVIVVLAGPERDAQRRSMVELHVLNESGQDAEIVALDVGGAPTFWNPTWNPDARQWTSAFPTSDSFVLRARAWTRTPLLLPDAQRVTLRLRMSPGAEPTSFTMSYHLPSESFCSIEIRLARSSVSLSECIPLAPMRGLHPAM